MGDHTENGQCGQGCCNSESDDMQAKLMWIGKKAKMEFLKEKIKHKLESKIGRKLDQEAELIADTMIARWKGEMEMEKQEEDFWDRFESIMEAK